MRSLHSKEGRGSGCAEMQYRKERGRARVAVNWKLGRETRLRQQGANAVRIHATEHLSCQLVFQLRSPPASTSAESFLLSSEELGILNPKMCKRYWPGQRQTQ